VEELDRPLCILHGSQDQLVNRPYLDQLVAPTLWRGAVQEIPGAGPSPQWKDAPLFNKILDQFVRDCA
jgi:pimeloyl-ACP methyl ester carboxylesterase